MSTIHRLNKELEEINNNQITNFSARVIEDDIFHWEAQIIGPEGTPYQGGFFNLRIDFPRDYPFKPPNVIFITRIYHCNINSSGNICLDILKENWSPALTISKVLLSICSLMDDQNPNDPLDSEVAELYLNNNKKFLEQAVLYTILYANTNNTFNTFNTFN